MKYDVVFKTSFNNTCRLSLKQKTKFVSYYFLFDAATILFLLRIGQNCKRSTVIQICGRPQKNREYGNCIGTYCLAVFQAVWHIADIHDELYDMQATNLKLSVKKQEWDMARVEKARIQSHCTFVYSLIKSFTYFFPIRSCQSFLNAIPQRQKQFLLSTANGRPDACKKKSI